MRSIIRPLSAAMLCAASFAAPANAGFISDNYSSFWVAGDSLSDPGNLFAATGGATPGTPYVDGRFTNGRVWADYIGADMIAAGKAYGNFAYGGAKAVTDDDGVPDLQAQLQMGLAASAGQLGDSPLAALWFGGNDMFEAIAAADMEQRAQDAAGAVADAASQILNHGVASLLMFTLPDLGKTPAYMAQGAAISARASLAAQIFNQTLTDQVEEWWAQGADIMLIDAQALLEVIIADPANGITDPTEPCIWPATPTICTEEDAKRKAYFDPVHPSAAVHRAAALAIDGAFAPVPVPLPAGAGLLLLGTALLGAARRKTVK